VFLLLCAAALALNGCARQSGPEVAHLPGFWLGLLHAWLLPFSFIGSLSTDYRIYAFPNSGRGYDFGYLIGVSALTGGAGRATKKGHTEE
jgi:hypothetical protein